MTTRTENAIEQDQITTEPDEITVAGGRSVARGLISGLSDGDTGVGAAEVRGFLERFGYLHVPAENARTVGVIDDDVRAALRQYQTFMGIPASGRLDEATVRAMTTVRCGEPDLPSPSRGATLAATAQESPFTLNEDYAPWDDTHLRWRQVNFPTELANATITRTIRHAFELWQAKLPFLGLTGVSNGQPADVSVRFAVGQHCAAAAFQSNNPLAHAPTVERGHIHINDAFKWVPDNSLPDDPNEFDLLTITAHEFGHVLGLGHSSNSKALMWPELTQGRKGLHADDIAGAKAKYPLGGKTSSMLFYQAGNGQWATGYPLAHGRAFGTTFLSEPGAFGTWSHIVGAGNGALLFYNIVNGQWSTAVLEPDDSVRTVFVSGPGAFARWTHITGVGNGALLFYNADNGQWSTAVLQGDGSLHTTFVSAPGSFSTWTHLTGAGNGALLAYNRNNGQWSTGVLQADGQFNTVFVSNPGSFSDWTHLVGAGNGAILAYNRSTGQWSTGVLSAKGEFETVTVSEPGSFAKWSHIVGTGRGALVSYDQARGQWATGTLQADGTFQHVFASELGAFSSWTHIACPTG